MSPAKQTPPATLWSDLVAALGELSDIGKARTANAGTYSYAYAGLGDVFAVVRPVLAAHGLAITQRITTDLEARTVTVATTILHTSGDSFDAGRITFPLGQTVQATGSTITYLRRYAILAALGITGADDDDDGHTAAQDAATPPTTSGQQTGRARMVSQAQMRKIGALMGDIGVDGDDDRRALVGALIGRPIKSRKDLTSAEASTVIDALEAINSGRGRLEYDDAGNACVVENADTEAPA